MHKEQKLNILIVDDDHRMAKTLSDIVNLRGFNADVAFDGFEALQKVKQSHFDCILTDIKMPEMNGIELYQAVNVEEPGIPVVLMTAYAADELIQEGLKDGAIAAIQKPLDISLLLNFFSVLDRFGSIMIVDDDPVFSQGMVRVLENRGYQLTVLNSPPFDIPLDNGTTPDIILLDVKLPGISGLEILQKVREKNSHLPIIMITAYPNEIEPDVRAAKECNVNTILYKPFDVNELDKLIIQYRNQQLSELFTGLGVYSR